MRARIEAVRADASDVEAVLPILEEAAGWLASRGIDQWRPGTLPGRTKDSIERGEMYLFRMGGRPVGTMALQWSDEEAWGDVAVAGEAGYVHLLAIRRDLSGGGLGRELLRWAEKRAALCGREYLRLDCAAENRALNAYYERVGFRPRGRASVGGLEVSLYEKRAGVDGQG